MQFAILCFASCVPLLVCIWYGEFAFFSLAHRKFFTEWKLQIACILLLLLVWKTCSSVAVCAGWESFAAATVRMIDVPDVCLANWFVFCSNESDDFYCFTKRQQLYWIFLACCYFISYSICSVPPTLYDDIYMDINVACPRLLFSFPQV